MRLVWASRAPKSGHAVEHVLPTGAMHLVLRLGDAPLRLLMPSMTFRGAVIGGARSRAYRKDLSHAVDSVGAVIEPGACAALLGIPASAASETHLSLADVWGDAEAHGLCERLDACRTLEARLALFESVLIERVRRACEVHPLVTLAVRALAVSPELSIAQLVQRSGFSHRVFVERFREAVGLGPKTYARVLRFQRAVAGVSTSIGGDDARLALETGYADQAHFCREFREMSGVSPAEYRAVRPASPNHVARPLASSTRRAARS